MSRHLDTYTYEINRYVAEVAFFLLGCNAPNSGYWFARAGIQTLSPVWTGLHTRLLVCTQYVEWHHGQSTRSRRELA